MQPKPPDKRKSLSTTCPHCKARYGGVPAIVVGKEVVCRSCKKRFVVQLDGAAKVNGKKRVSPEPAATRREPRLYDPEKVPTILVDDDMDPRKGGEANLDWGLGDVILDLYEVTGFLGQGGMGRVYRVSHLGWQVDLAVKTPTPETLDAAGGAENFEKEAETWVNLGLHPHTVSCYYVRRVRDVPCVFAEYVAGGSLHDWIIEPDGEPGKLYHGRTRQVQERILDVAIQFAYGLEYAHQQELIHQDIKPANVLITPEGLVKVTDFGLAMARPTPEQAAATNEDCCLPGPGTPQYFSPEQSLGRSLTLHSDLWSWGLCILEMFKGGRTWDSGTIAGEALEEYLAEGPEEDWLPPMPEKVADLLRSCFQVDPEKRPGNLGVAADRLIDVYETLTGKKYERPRPKSGKDTANSLNNRAVSLVDLKRSLEAEVLWSQVAAVQPHHLESTYNQGLIRWRRARQDDTALLKQLAESIKSHGDDEKSIFLTALVHLERGDLDAVIKSLEALPESGIRSREVQEVLKKAQTGLDRSTRMLSKVIENKGSINSVFLNKNGNRAIIAGEDKDIRFWDLEAGRLLTVLKGHEGLVNDIAVSMDGKHMISGGGDFTHPDYDLRLWDLNGGRIIKTLKGHVKAVNTVSIGVNGRLAVSGGDDSNIRVWDLTTGKTRQVLVGHKSTVNTVKLNHEGTQILSGGADRTIKLWDTQSGRCLRTFTGHQGTVSSLSFNGLQPIFVSAGTDQTVRLWDLESGKCVKIMAGHKDEVNVVCMSYDGRLAVSGSSDNTLKIWDLETGRCLRTLDGHRSWVLTAALNRQASLLLSGGLDTALCLWRVDQRLEPIQSPLSLARITSSETIVSAADNYERILNEARQALEIGREKEAAELVGKARKQTGFARGREAMALWRALYPHLPRKGFQGGWEENAFTAHTQAVECCRTAPDDKLAATGDLNGNVFLWDIETQNQVAELEKHASIVRSVDLTGNGEWVATGGQDGMVHIWRITDRPNCLHKLKAHAKGVGAVRFSPDSKQVYTCGRDHSIKIWNRDSGRLLSEFKGHHRPVNTLAISRDGRKILSGSGDYTGQDCVLRLWEPDGWCIHVFEGHRRAVNTVCLSPDGQTAVSGAADGEIRCWDLEKGAKTGVLEGHDGSVNALCITGNGLFAISGGTDHTMRLWDIKSGRCLRIFEGHTASINDIALGRDDQYILSVSDDKTVKIWTLDWEL